MNELQLSSNLKQIELEINHHKQIAGQSIWEIGRRLNHVKENDLVHGEFMNWVEKQGIKHSEALRMMKVANEIPNSPTLANLGSTALHLIATLPEEQKQEQLSKAELGNPSTVRELQELKKQLKEKDKQIENLSEVITDQEPKVVEKQVEVIPDDYQELKSKVSNADYYKEQNETLKTEVKQLEESYRELLSERSAVDEQSDKYEQLSKAINQAKGQLNESQKMISNYKKLSDLLTKSNEFLSVASSLVYQDLSEVISRDGLAKRELNFLIERLEMFLNDLNRISKNEILEGEIINE
ncbi:DUF3102 domain-containing protein [Vagococcus fluvialis]|uniref:DUF3102 domain-containing protein n=1 Tax=Vagococcus fluvialis TaxID=2738 RepID=UPI0028924820|nr:DUF3102 domain-containing protein [Vagococcus fluvialis]MDT2782780.1 DUF3102 domain-containing protein [Vagococcus fluvialis]